MHLKNLNKIFLIDNRIHYDQLMVTTKLPKKIAKLQQHFLTKKVTYRPCWSFVA